MNKVCVTMLLYLLLTATVWGQPLGMQEPDVVAQQRERIEAQRQEKTMALDAQEADCWSKFAVTDCLNKVKTQRRAMLGELKRQDIRVNDRERQQRAAQQLQRNRDKATEKAERRSELRSPTVVDSNTLELRQEQLKEKVLSHQQQVKVVAPSVPASKATSTLDAQSLERNRNAYAEKLRALEQRRQAREKKLLEKGGSGVPLPRDPQ